MMLLGDNPSSSRSISTGIDPNQLWEAGNNLQSSMWLTLLGAGCFVLASTAGPENSQVMVLGVGLGITFDVFSLVKMFVAGVNLKKASGLKNGGRPITKGLEPDKAESINCLDLPDPVERYNCSRAQRGK